jgi:hypothetical protein
MSSFGVVVVILINDVKQPFGENFTLCDVMVNDGNIKLKANLFFKQTFELHGAMVAKV